MNQITHALRKVQLRKHKVRKMRSGHSEDQCLSRAFNFSIFACWPVHIYQNGCFLPGDWKAYKIRFVTGIYPSL